MPRDCNTVSANFLVLLELNRDLVIQVHLLQNRPFQPMSDNSSSNHVGEAGESGWHNSLGRGFGFQHKKLFLSTGSPSKFVSLGMALNIYFSCVDIKEKKQTFFSIIHRTETPEPLLPLIRHGRRIAAGEEEGTGDMGSNPW